MLPVVTNGQMVSVVKSMQGVGGGGKWTMEGMTIMCQSNPILWGEIRALGIQTVEKTEDGTPEREEALLCTQAFIAGAILAYRCLHAQDEANELEKQWGQ